MSGDGPLSYWIRPVRPVQNGGSLERTWSDKIELVTTKMTQILNIIYKFLSALESSHVTS